MSANFSILGLLSLARLTFAAEEVVLVDLSDGRLLSAGHDPAADGPDRAFVEALAARVAAGLSPVPGENTAEWHVFDDKSDDHPAYLLIKGATRVEAPQAMALSARAILQSLRAARETAAERKALEHARSVMRGLEQMTDIGVWQYDIDAGRVTWSDVTYKVHGVNRDTFAPTYQNILEFYPDEVRLLVEASVEQAVETGTGFSFVLPFVRADQELRMVRTIGSLVRDEAGDHLYGICQDITEMKEAELRLWWTANHDALTSLPNRMLFQERLDSALSLARQHGQSVGLILIDLDHFKSINDIYGHEAGDQVLTIVAARLGMFTRQGDTLARLGGDEFAIILNGLAGPDALNKPMDRLLSAAEVTFAYRDIPIPVKLSMGAAVFPRDAENERELYRNADLALFHSKADSRRRATIYEPQHGAERAGREEELRRIRETITAGAVVPHFQPIFDLATGGIASIEVLARRRGDEDLQSAAPLELAFDDPELGPRLGLLILDNLRAGWCNLPAELLEGSTISINVSDQELRNLAYLEALGRFFGHCKKLKFDLIVELQSNPAHSLPRHVMPTFERLVDRGLAFSFDNLTAGFGALVESPNLEVRQIKASKAMLTDPTVEERAAAIIGGMIETCRKLGVQLVATNIESETELGQLRELGYTYGQGFFFCRAMPLEQLASLLDDEGTNRDGRPRRGATV